jgi:hypothetical protein
MVTAGRPRRQLAAVAAAKRSTSRTQLAWHGQTKLRGRDDANDSDEANEKSVLDQRRAALIHLDGVDQLEKLWHYVAPTWHISFEIEQIHLHRL